MINYIIIFFSQSNCKEHLSVIKRTMTSIIEWTQDLEDCDKVIRVSTSKNISVELLENFTKIGLKAELMAVYQVDQQ
jgi:hypothetical protein